MLHPQFYGGFGVDLEFTPPWNYAPTFSAAQIHASRASNCKMTRRLRLKRFQDFLTPIRVRTSTQFILL